MALDTLHDT